MTFGFASILVDTDLRSNCAYVTAEAGGRGVSGRRERRRTPDRASAPARTLPELRRRGPARPGCAPAHRAHPDRLERAPPPVRRGPPLLGCPRDRTEPSPNSCER